MRRGRASLPSSMKTRHVVGSPAATHSLDEVKEAQRRERERIRSLRWVFAGGLTLATLLVGSCTAACVRSLCCGCAPADRVRSQAYEIGKAVALFQIGHGRLPRTVAELGEDVDGKPRIMDRVPRDPWGNAWVLAVPGRLSAPFSVISPGPDGVLATEDDGGNWPDG